MPDAATRGLAKAQRADLVSFKRLRDWLRDALLWPSLLDAAHAEEAGARA